ncbi:MULTISPECIES: endonuclease domain-containing protein [Pseudonocardia]|uniref:DUF559 domain-containing protein n=2 Tax=Pseudonocardia TaxID=1847 RepID=A0A1Y2N858_PSEAH|nr:MULTISPECIES: hypothetical protein [Pseudonocardia]OSY43624.1 hypothetical protein BG845_00570 [Pseudonocardia autotrophica]TDN73386.1 hypothetical protein C8E95_2479 [Pseudonocardia autotrophica]
MEPFRGSVAVARGRLTKGMLRGPGFRRLFPDVYVHASVQVTSLVLARAAALVADRAGGVAAGFSAAELLGASCGPLQAPAEVLAPGRIRSRNDLVARRGEVTGSGLADGARVTSPLRTAWDLVRRLGQVDAVVALDALAARRDRPTFVPHPPGVPPHPDLIALSRLRSRSLGFAPDDLLRWRDTHPGARGCAGLDRIVALADPRAESPPETRLRLLLVLAGMPAPQVQYRLAVEGRTVRFDLAYPEALLAIEYDGSDHDDPLDRARDVRTSALGWHTLRITAADLTRTPDRTLTVIRTLHQRRSQMLRAERHTSAPRP